MPALDSSNAIVTVVTVSGRIYVGTFLGIRHHDGASIQGDQFLYVQLTSSVAPYAMGEVIALNLFLVESIGPVIFP